ncbi:hypothetical protein IJ531_03540 [bacterium]|nr:hypothetical protein [bacterium]
MKIIPLNFARGRMNFCANMRELYGNFQGDVLDYLSCSEYLSLRQIERILKNYSPETNISTMDEYYKHNQDIRNPEAIAQIPLNIEFDEEGNPQFKTLPKTMFLTSFKNLDNESLLNFFAKLFHEATHIFQSEADDRMNIAQLCQIYYDNTGDFEKIKNTVSVMDEIFIELDNNAARAYQGVYNLGYKRESQREEGFRKYFHSSVDEFFMSGVALSIINKKERTNNIDYGLLLDYIALRANDEKEAYLNTLNFIRPFINYDGAHVGLRIEMYDKMAKAALDARKNL